MDIRRAILVVLVWAALLALVGAQCLHPDWVLSRGSCYLFPTAQDRHEGSREESQAYCTNLGAHLISINDAEESEFVQQAVLNVCQSPSSCASSLWLGLDPPDDLCTPCSTCPPCDISHRRDGWEWQDGSPHLWANWSVSEPAGGHQCAAMRTQTVYRGTWENRDCQMSYITVCETPAEIPLRRFARDAVAGGRSFWTIIKNIDEGPKYTILFGIVGSVAVICMVVMWCMGVGCEIFSCANCNCGDFSENCCGCWAYCGNCGDCCNCHCDCPSCDCPSCDCPSCCDCGKCWDNCGSCDFGKCCDVCNGCDCGGCGDCGCGSCDCNF